MASTADKGKRGKRRAKSNRDAESTPASAEALLARLDVVVAELESGDLPLEQALTHFEEGIRLVREGGKLLGRVEQRIEMLLADDRVVPFPDGRDGTAEPADDEDHPG